MTLRTLAIAAGLALAGATFVPMDVSAATQPAHFVQAEYSSQHGTYFSTVDDGATFMQIVFDHAPIDRLIYG